MAARASDDKAHGASTGARERERDPPSFRAACLAPSGLLAHH
ncbi:MAG: hypothetical protein OXC62_16140 [Aestuariivita sp.]|nr:hypothetical protein [Aestuariivita sp.]